MEPRLDGNPAPARKGHCSSPLFGQCLMWPRSPISATAELLLYIIKHKTVISKENKGD